MYLHIGSGQVIYQDDVIGIFDLDKVSVSPRTRGFLERQEEENTLTILGERIPASLVVTKKTAYLSPVSSQTLNRRLLENKLDSVS